VSQTILVTGAAGFIGFHVSTRLLKEGYRVVGLDNINPYYDPALKESRLEKLLEDENFVFLKQDLEDYQALHTLFEKYSFFRVCHLAAQAGVRYSLEDPFCYGNSNLMGFLNILECCRHFPVNNLVYASSSSVYGKCKDFPFNEDAKLDEPISLYAATKKANELMAHSYSHLFGIPSTGLRFFTVYGPYGRPDMALFLFCQAILNHEPIKVFNHGKMKRDFTYIDDIVDGVILSLETPRPFEIYNLGNHQMVELERFINCIENELGMKAEKQLLPIQPGDVPETCADIQKARDILGYNPQTSVEKGVKEFVAWYRSYYQVGS